MDRKKPAVPKFASFKPQAESPSKSPPPHPDKGHGRRAVDREDHDEPVRSRHTTKAHHSRPRRHDRQRSRSPERATPNPAPREEPLYTVDKRGDPLIVRYGSNERARVPAYRRAGAGRVMGAAGRLRLLHDGSKELFSLGDKFGEGPSAFRDRNLLYKASRRKTRVFRLRSGSDQKQTQPVEDELDFVPLYDSRKTQDPKEDSYTISEGEEPNYRSIQGKAKARDFVDSDLESADSSDSDAEVESDPLNPTKQKAIELSRQVKDHPEDVEAWLELVDLQEDLLRLTEDVRQSRTSDEVKGLASIRVSLLEEAMSHVQKSDLERLLLRLMREGSRVWSSKAIAKRWADISLKNSSFALWEAHLEYELSNMSTFTYGGLKKMHTERLRYLSERLSQDIHNALASHPNQLLEEVCHSHSDISDGLARIFDEFVYVFMRATCFLRDAGYSELAVAAWQAMLELTFARPADDPDTDPVEVMSSFKDFWESEVPRIGEDGAKGWRHFTEAEELADLPEGKTEAVPAQPDTRDVYRAWAAVESQRRRRAALPARTLDEGTEDDPFRVVMFADLEPLLFCIPSVVLGMPKAKVYIVDGFLLFCQLPAASASAGDLIQSLRKDSPTYRESARLGRRDSERPSDAEDGARRPPRFSEPGRRLMGSADVMFSDAHWFGFFNRDPSPENGLALTAMIQLTTSFGYEPVAEYSLALAYNKTPTAVRKTAKALLKKWPNNTSLYNGYAVAEWRNGNLDMSRTVLLSATSQDIREKECLWTTWAWLDLEAGDMRSALARCIAATGTDQTNAETTATYSQLLKARQNFSSSREFLLSIGNMQRAALYAETSSLLEYLSPFAGSTEHASSRQGDIQRAMDTIDTFTSEALTRAHSKSAHLERLLQFAAHLLYLHATRGPFRPAHLRDQLRKFTTLFPSNTVFLTLFSWTDTSILINDPVRQLLRTHVLTKAHDCLTSRLFAIQHEMHTGSAHSVRAAFERALDSNACRGNVGLWLSYVRFCGGHAKELRGASVKAKDVFYRAISACPWSKELAMEAFTTLVRDMDSGELRAVFNTITDKGLRVHVDLEEFGAEWVKKT